MKTILFSGLAASALLFGATDAGASDSASGGAFAANITAMQGATIAPGTTIKTISRQHYRRPFRGFMVPSFWMQPRFYVSNYQVLGLARPSNGYRWSRYYDDAVLADPRGYVHDYRSGVNWNAGHAPQGGYHDQPAYGPAMRPDAQA